MKNHVWCFNGYKEPSKKIEVENLVGYQGIDCHMISGINVDGKFTSKVRFLSSSHNKNPQTSIS